MKFVYSYNAVALLLLLLQNDVLKINFCKANYALREDDKIAVTNTGIKEGKNKTSNGKAKTTDTPALLRVSLFGPFYSD